MFNTLTSCIAMLFLLNTECNSIKSYQRSIHTSSRYTECCYSPFIVEERVFVFSLFFQSSTSRVISFNLSINISPHVHHVILLLMAMNILKHVDLFLGLLVFVIKNYIRFTLRNVFCSILCLFFLAR
jgi:hypothetical protein